MLDRHSANDAFVAFAPPAARPLDTPFLRQRVAALTRTIDERQATIASLVQQLHRARNDPARSASVGRISAGAAHEIGAPIQRVTEDMRCLRRGFDLIQRILAVYDAGDDELRRLRTTMPGMIDRALDDLDRVASVVRAMENFSPTATPVEAP